MSKKKFTPEEQSIYPHLVDLIGEVRELRKEVLYCLSVVKAVEQAIQKLERGDE